VDAQRGWTSQVGRALFPETSGVFPRRKMLLAGKKHDPFKETPDAMVAQPQPGRRQPKSQ
jgi:hypothetical protein